MKNCPHSGEKREPKVHFLARARASAWVQWSGCGLACITSLTPPSRPLFATDKSLVTCLSCKKTQAFREAK